jgi:hypothetical protein
VTKFKVLSRDGVEGIGATKIKLKSRYLASRFEPANFRQKQEGYKFLLIKFYSPVFTVFTVFTSGLTFTISTF